MNDLYNETIERKGKIYHYDPDMDCYYCKHNPESTASKWAWVWCVVLLAVVCYCIEYRPIVI